MTDVQSIKKYKRLIILGCVSIVLIIIVIMYRWGSISLDTSSLTTTGGWLMPFVLAAAIVDSINPCAFSVLLLTVAFLLSIGRTRSNIISIGATYITGLYAVYLLIGLGILQTLYLFNTPHFMARVGATILMVVGSINIINDLFPAFPIKLKIPQIAHHRLAKLMKIGSYPTAFGLGILVGLFEFPCTGGPYLMILGLLHDRMTYLSGLGYLIVYNMMFVMPLAIILLMASDTTLLDTVNTWKKKQTSNMRFWGGIITIILGLIIFVL